MKQVWEYNKEELAEMLALVQCDNDMLRSTIEWIVDHSNDPGVVEKGRKALAKEGE